MLNIYALKLFRKSPNNMRRNSVVFNLSFVFSISPDRARYEGSVRLANLTALRDSMAATGPTRTLQNILEKQVRLLTAFILLYGVIVILLSLSRKMNMPQSLPSSFFSYHHG
jgi:hypothetical protein